MSNLIEYKQIQHRNPRRRTNELFALRAKDPAADVISIQLVRNSPRAVDLKREARYQKKLARVQAKLHSI